MKDKLTEEVVRLREVWADSQEQVSVSYFVSLSVSSSVFV